MRKRCNKGDRKWVVIKQDPTEDMGVMGNGNMTGLDRDGVGFAREDGSRRGFLCGGGTEAAQCKERKGEKREGKGIIERRCDGNGGKGDRTGTGTGRAGRRV